MSEQAKQSIANIIRIYQTETDPGKKMLMELLVIRPLEEKLKGMKGA